MRSFQDRRKAAERRDRRRWRKPAPPPPKPDAAQIERICYYRLRELCLLEGGEIVGSAKELAAKAGLPFHENAAGKLLTRLCRVKEKHFRKTRYRNRYFYKIVFKKSKKPIDIFAWML